MKKSRFTLFEKRVIGFFAFITLAWVIFLGWLTLKAIDLIFPN